jgi:hypothetical protein
MAAQPFHGPLAELPGSDAYETISKLPDGFQAVPLSTVEQMAAAAN